MRDLSATYAAALYALLQDEETVTAAGHVLMDREELWSALNSPVIRPAEKKAVLARLPQLGAQPVLLHFFQLLCDKGRMALLPEILAAYRACALEERGAAVCRMRCVHPPKEAQRQALCALLCRLHHKREVLLDIETDKTLLGGFLLTIEGVTYDRSVRGQLTRLERQLQERRIV